MNSTKSSRPSKANSRLMMSASLSHWSIMRSLSRIVDWMADVVMDDEREDYWFKDAFGAAIRSLFELPPDTDALLPLFKSLWAASSISGSSCEAMPRAWDLQDWI